MATVQGIVSGYQLQDGMVQVTVSAPHATGNPGGTGQQMATLRMLLADAPPIGSIVEVSLRVIAQ